MLCESGSNRDRFHGVHLESPTSGSRKGSSVQSFANQDSSSLRGGLRGKSGISKLQAAVKLLRTLDPEMELQSVLAFLLVARTPNRPVPMATLGEEVGVAQSSISRNVQKWGEVNARGGKGLGCFVVTEDPYDHRIRLVGLTQRGRMLAEQLEAICQ